MPLFDITEKRPLINIFKLVGAYYFKHFFDDAELFRELEPFYEKARYRFRMATAGEIKSAESVSCSCLGQVSGDIAAKMGRP